MFRVAQLHTTPRDIMDSFLSRHEDSIDGMESMLDMMEDWNEMNRMIGPRHCFSSRQRPSPYITPTWRSVRKFRPVLDDVPLMIVRSGDDILSSMKSAGKPVRSNLRKGTTQNNKEDSIGSKKEKEQSKETTVSKESCKDKSVDKVWRYSVDVGGCDEVRAFTEDGLLVVEGRGRDSDSSVMLRHVTTLPPHVKADTLTATQKGDQLLLSHKGDTAIPAVLNIPITKMEEKKTSGNKTVSNDEQQHESNTSEGNNSSIE